MKYVLLILNLVIVQFTFGQKRCDSAMITYYKSLNEKNIKRITYYDSNCKVHPEINEFKRNGSLKFIYHYKHGKFQYYLKYKNGEVCRENGLKINRAASPFNLTKELYRLNDSVINQLDSNGNKTGLWYEVDYIEDLSGLTSKNLVMIGDYLNGQRQGSWKFYHQYGGQLYKVVEYENDLIEGAVKYYDRNGILRSEYIYQNNYKNGIYKSYYLNGAKHEIAYLIKGEFHGRYIEYKKNGKIKRIIEDASLEYPYK